MRVADFKVCQGGAWSRQFSYKTCDGTAIDLTGHDIRMQVYKSVRSTTPLIELGIGTGVVLGAAIEEFSASLTGTQTDSLPCGCWVYKITDLTLDDILVKGSFTVEAQP